MRFARFPKYPKKSHRSGQARIRLNGKDEYLGLFNSRESRELYARLKAEWEAARGRAAVPIMRATGVRTVADLFAKFLQHAVQHYRRADGQPTQEVANYRQTARPIVRLFGGLELIRFGKRELKEVRTAMVSGSWLTDEEKQGRDRRGFPNALSRKLINQRIRKVKHVFWWGEDEELIPEGIFGRLASVRGLEEGRTTAPDYDEIAPVPDADVTATLPHLGPVVGAMVQLQRFSGMRPGEICDLKPDQIDRKGIQVDGDVVVWVYRPPQHKTRHKGVARAIALGPRAQAVLVPFLDRDQGKHCFSARESKAAHHKERTAKRKLKKSRAKAAEYGTLATKDHFTIDAYYRRVRRACIKAGVPHWHPNRLRHSAATEAEEKFSLDDARTLLGHKTPNVTAIYAARDLKRAAQIAAQIG